MKKTNRYFQMHIALIIIFVTLFLEATTHNVSDFFFDENEIYFLDPELINNTLNNDSTNLFTSYSTHPEFHLFLFFIWIGSFLYALCLMNWYTARPRSFVEILFFMCCPFVYLPFVQTVWHRIMRLIRPRANNENRYVIHTARNINSPARETEDYSKELRESRLLRVD